MREYITRRPWGPENTARASGGPADLSGHAVAPRAVAVCADERQNLTAAR